MCTYRDSKSSCGREEVFCRRDVRIVYLVVVDFKGRQILQIVMWTLRNDAKVLLTYTEMVYFGHVLKFMVLLLVSSSRSLSEYSSTR